LLFQINQVAILPLGTGNDIARVTGWGSGYKGQKISTILAEVAVAEIQSLDRWSVEMKQKGGEHKVDKHVMSVYPPSLVVHLQPSLLTTFFSI